MKTTLSILNGSGDTKLTWDNDNPEEVAAARAQVAELATLGYSFFLTDGTPADAVTAGVGTLIVRKLTAEEVVPVPAQECESEPEPAPTPKRRGRPPKAKVAPDTNVVAVRPLRGG